MKNKSLLFPFLLIGLLSLVGCNQSNQGSVNPSKREDRIVLNASKVQLNLNDTFQLEISYSNSGASEATTFTSHDPNIVSVDDTGFVTALAEGKTNVEVTKGKATAKCTFTVSLADEIPYIEVEGVLNNHIEIDLITDYEINAKTKFGGRYFDIENLAYEIISVDGNGEMQGNIFHPTQKGNVTIKISGEYNGNVMHNYYLSILVKESIVFSLRDENEGPREFGSVYLYTIASFKGQTYKTTFKPVLSVTVDGVDKSSEATFELIDANNVLDYESSTNLITSNIAGEAVLRMHYQTYISNVKFYVNYLVDKSGVEDIVIDASVGEFPSEQIFADFPGDSQIVKATSVDYSEEYEVTAGKVLGLKSHNLAKQQIIVYNNVMGFIIDFKAYQKIIREPEDLSVFCITVANADAVDSFQNDGYYILANDLDCSGITYPNSTRVLGRGASSVEPRCGFMGTFDGQGHTIKNYKAPREGMFLVLGNGSVVKNVGFVDAILDCAHGNDRFVLATYCFGATISNVFINSKGDMANVLDNALVAACFSSTCSFNNCIFEYTGSATRGSSQGSFTNLNELGMPQFSNTYVVSPIVMTIYKTYYADTRAYPELDAQGLTFRQYSGVKHYFGYDEMEEDNLNYDSFSSQYWDCSTGVPVWK